MRLILIALILSLGICGCHHTYTEQDFVNSKWVDSEGAVIELYKDGTCDVKDIKWDLIYPSSWLKDSVWKEKHPQSFVGYWTIKQNRQDGQEISIQIGQSGYGFSFEINNIDTIAEIVGDPDDGKYYKFARMRIR